MMASGGHTLEELESIDARTIMPTYARNRVEFVRGHGATLIAADGREYLDFLAGIAVVSIGHAHPEVAAAVSDQMNTLVHVTNLFYTVPQFELAEKIQAITGWGKVYFSNSGTEANECALKLVRLHAREAGHATGQIVAVEGSFHGRTLGSLSITGQPSKREPFDPLVPGCVFVPPGDTDALEASIEGAAAVFIEVVQGEGGVVPAGVEYLKRARELCDESGALMVIDEIQTGLCRTGEWLAFEHAGIAPDIYTLGKALGNGLPVAATVARDEVAELFSPGDHGSTMAAGPVVCRAAGTVLDIMRRDDLAAAAREKGRVLAGAVGRLPGVIDLRGMGLLLAAELDRPSKPVVDRALDAGLIVNAVTPTAIRFAPPLVISDAEIEKAVEKLAAALDEKS